ncbi:hypothetical protein H0264_11495 [Nocardia huaxiensis]|uniref:DUF1273 domain-containing protein n=1 Tax=Nocardia huaxiensis TaxID=2755382 RepID=A0A7D6Z4Q8_9NOCA|nr:hypothetical protein [Nocardia huaxiensis]QLY32786.1 hypothetical protein H0264_11495 [Nocardia huaxiensis]
MTRIGITGHIHLTDETIDLVHTALQERLRPYDTCLTGVSCLAPGADTIFAGTVLALGGRLEVILPARSYRNQALPTDRLSTFDSLLNRASSVRVMPYARPSPTAYRAANGAVLAAIDRLLAVWDGATGDPGSTADTVHAAKTLAIPVEIIWPLGAQRSRI